MICKEVIIPIYFPFAEIEASSPSSEQDKAISEHSIPLGKPNTFYCHSE